MEIKKDAKVNMEKYRSIFLQVGLVATLVALFLLFEWTTSDAAVDDLGQMEVLDIEEEIIEITRQDVTPPPPPPPPEQPSDILEIVDDDVDLQDELELNLDFEEDEEMDIQIVEFEEVEEETVEEVFLIVEDMPEFPGGEVALRKFIAENIKYPEIALENDIQGKVYVRFVVTSTGAVDQVQVARGVDPLLDEEAVRVVKQLPKWTPGRQRGKNVSVWYTVPINFQLN